MPQLLSSAKLRQLQKHNTYIAFFGAGYITDKTITKSQVRPQCIVDNNTDIQSTFQDLIPIVSLADVPNHAVYVITSTSIAEIERQLHDHGVLPENIHVSPVLSDHYQISIFENQYFDLLFTSGLQNRSQDTSIEGGGLYRLSGYFDDFKLSKVLSSPSHGIKKLGDYLYIVNEDVGVAKLDINLNIVDTFALPKGIRPHGIDYCQETDNWVFACSYGDCLSIHNKSFEEVDRVYFSNKRTYFQNKPQHHTNDVCVNGRLAFCSMFSLSGEFKRGVYDGGVLIIDIVERKVIGSMFGDLSHPHNIQFHDSEYWVLDSYTQRVIKGSTVYSSGYSSFLRGLDFLSDGSLLLGQSKNRNFSTIKNSSTSPSFLDTSIVVLSPDQLIAKPLPLPSSISEIHAILSLTN